MTTGTTYTLDYWLYSDGGTPNDFAAQINLAGTGLNPGGTDIPGSVLTNAGSFPYTEYTFNFTATGSTTTVGFRFRQDPAYWDLDDVSVNATATPEPASLTLLGLGIAGLAGYGWRRRKQQVANA